MNRKEAIKKLKEELKELVTWLVIHRHDKEICEPKERRQRAIEAAIISLEQDDLKDKEAYDYGYNDGYEDAKELFS